MFNEENDEGVRSVNQIQGVDINGNLRNIRVDENGALKISGGETNGKTLMCDVVVVGTENTSIAINKKVTKIELANYAESSKLTAHVGDKVFKIAPNMVVDIIVGDIVESIELLSEEEGTQVQYIVEGEE